MTFQLKGTHISMLHWHRRSQDVLWGCIFASKLTTFLVVALNTQAKTAKLTTPTIQISPANIKFYFLLCLGVHLPLSHKSRFFPSRGVYVHHCNPWLRLCALGSCTVTSAKGVMFYSTFVCLSVCLSISNFM